MSTHLSHAVVVGACLREVAVSRIVPHQVLGQVVHRIEVRILACALRQFTQAHLVCVCDRHVLPF